MNFILSIVFTILFSVSVSAISHEHCTYEPVYSDSLEIVYVSNTLITKDSLYAGMAHYILVDNEEETVWAFFNTLSELDEWINKQSYDAYCRRILYVYKN
jgi:hypothetical protein